MSQWDFISGVESVRDFGGWNGLVDRRISKGLVLWITQAVLDEFSNSGYTEMEVV